MCFSTRRRPQRRRQRAPQDRQQQNQIYLSLNTRWKALQAADAAAGVARCDTELSSGAPSSCSPTFPFMISFKGGRQRQQLPETKLFPNLPVGAPPPNHRPLPSGGPQCLRRGPRTPLPPCETFSQ
ncbi:hypothetical protein cyc_05972 [Cyclospora cayetanensis]|uniref:Uncharacterized protein n=1 Tax=Cyclospora cayetanensis TaxID=88456 RepID=A0A1D3CW01_9EIME|nr:hypothetical protein cyc_05972 [Cyclospora cayetanensis]